MMEFAWKKLPEITDERKMDELEVHDFFLYGTNMINQKQNKTLGQEISYYQVVSKGEKGNVVYAPVFDILERNIIEGD